MQWRIRRHPWKGINVLERLDSRYGGWEVMVWLRDNYEPVCVPLHLDGAAIRLLIAALRAEDA